MTFTDQTAMRDSRTLQIKKESPRDEMDVRSPTSPSDMASEFLDEHGAKIHPVFVAEGSTTPNPISEAGPKTVR